MAVSGKTLRLKISKPSLEVVEADTDSLHVTTPDGLTINLFIGDEGCLRISAVGGNIAVSPRAANSILCFPTKN